MATASPAAKTPPSRQDDIEGTGSVAGPLYVRALQLASVLAPPVCTAVWVVAALRRPGYNSVTQLLSELEIGPGGWLQRANFLSFGALELAFAAGLARTRWATWPMRLGASLIAAFALGWITIGLFVDADPLSYRTRLHNWGVRLFLALPLASLTIAGTVRSRWLRTYSLLTGIVGVLLAPGLYTNLFGTRLAGRMGLYQRAYYLLFFAWLEALALFVVRLRWRTGLGPSALIVPRRHPLRTITAAGLALACALLLMLPVQPSVAQTVPSGLPRHFGFGVAAGQGDTWMPQSGIAWDYRFQYLAGGVNTGQGWENWNPNGTFALSYAQESAQHGYIPMFPYYELLQSSGSCDGCGEGQRDITNLNTPSLMAAYYQNFALLMKRLGPGTYDGIAGFGKTALVNVEPDFAGGYAVQAVNKANACFGACTGQGNDPSLLKAAVASSGYADVAGYPDTYQGFTQALAHLRDLYAPNVLLGYEVSPWATGDDIGVDTSPRTNGAALGQQVGRLLGAVGPHEVLFNDPLDRDAGQYKALFGQNRWWDRLNQTFPNFARWEQYLKGASDADGSKPILLWQVPVGNQYFDTENNTDGHYQDNRAEYIFSHVPELIQAGIIGAMFSPGNAGSTSYDDALHDGVTNPPSFCTTDGISAGSICNTQTASVSDDDGGFIRMSAQAYYQDPVALADGAPATAAPTAMAAVTASSPATQASYTTMRLASPSAN